MVSEISSKWGAMSKNRIFSSVLIMSLLVGSQSYAYVLSHFFYCLGITAKGISQGKANDQRGIDNELLDGTLTIYNPNALHELLAGSIPAEINEIVEFLHNPEPFSSIGAQMPKGILLYGPPGTGKTSIARAIAQSAGAAFLHASGSEFIEVYVGVGAGRVRDLFNKARQAIKDGKNKSAIIFIDEIDAIGGGRNGFNMCSEHQQTINQLLTEMDGFKQDESIVVMAATNRIDILDSALLRPGRFDRKVYIGLPDKASRKAILLHYLKNCLHDETVDVDYLADVTDRMSGADLKNLVNEAAIRAVRDKEVKVTQKHFERALSAC